MRLSDIPPLAPGAAPVHVNQLESGYLTPNGTILTFGDIHDGMVTANVRLRWTLPGCVWCGRLTSHHCD